MHVSSRNASLDYQKKINRYQRSENISPYKPKLREGSTEKGKVAHRKLQKDVFRQISGNIKSSCKDLKEANSKKNIKRKVMIYNI